MLQNAFEERVQKEAETVLKGRLKEADHLGNGNNIRREKVKTPDTDIRRRSITSSEGLSIQRLNSARAHNVRVPHDSPQLLPCTTRGYLKSVQCALATVPHV